jgi:hypothetical protein
MLFFLEKNLNFFRNKIIGQTFFNKNLKDPLTIFKLVIERITLLPLNYTRYKNIIAYFFVKFFFTFNTF